MGKSLGVEELVKLFRVHQVAEIALLDKRRVIISAVRGLLFFHFEVFFLFLFRTSVDFLFSESLSFISF